MFTLNMIYAYQLQVITTLYFTYATHLMLVPSQGSTTITPSPLQPLCALPYLPLHRDQQRKWKINTVRLE